MFYICSNNFKAMKYLILPVIILSIVILNSCRDTVTTPTGPIPIQTLVLSVDSVYITDQSANMFSIDTTFQNCSIKKFRLSFTASTNDTDDNAFLGASFTDSLNNMIWSYAQNGKSINLIFSNEIVLEYQENETISFHFSMWFSVFHNPPVKWLKLLNFKLFSIT
jgi:SUMO ligase MMS21 Smc5/6 complex component